MFSIGLNPNHIARFDCFKRFQCAWQERREPRIIVSFRGWRDNGDTQAGDVLLIWKILIDCDEYVVNA
jgi:hypothetical protein